MGVTTYRDEYFKLLAFLEREGYRKCDIAACNCGSWHKPDTLQNRQGEWAVETFGDERVPQIIKHLYREVEELDEAQTKGSIPEEAADCYLLLLAVAHHEGFSLNVEAEKKLKVNRTRTWGEPDAEGVREHVREDSTPPQGSINWDRTPLGPHDEHPLGEM
ncbi:MAG: DUF550 domain-containing protein [bacterium]|nr:DUF550 domain-containing protein [bacterium]